MVLVTETEMCQYCQSFQNIADSNISNLSGPGENFCVTSLGLVGPQLRHAGDNVFWCWLVWTNSTITECGVWTQSIGFLEIFALMRCFAHITQNYLNLYLICSYQCINSSFMMNVSHYYNNPMNQKGVL